MQTDLSRSAALYERALKVLPGGVSRNAILRGTHPTYVEYGAADVSRRARQEDPHRGRIS